MERSDWSCTYCRQGRHGIIPYYRSNEEILGHFMIGREQFHHQGALRVNCWKLEVYDAKLGDMKSLCLEVHVLKVCVMTFF